MFSTSFISCSQLIIIILHQSMSMLDLIFSFSGSMNIWMIVICACCLSKEIKPMGQWDRCLISYHYKLSNTDLKLHFCNVILCNSTVQQCSVQDYRCRLFEWYLQYKWLTCDQTKLHHHTYTLFIHFAHTVQPKGITSTMIYISVLAHWKTNFCPETALCYTSRLQPEHQTGRAKLRREFSCLLSSSFTTTYLYGLDWKCGNFGFPLSCSIYHQLTWVGLKGE